MEIVGFCFCIAVDIYVVLDFLKPLRNKKYLKDGYKLKFISPIWNYGILFLASLGMIYSLSLLIKESSIHNLIFFNIIFITIMFEISKSYILICKDGIFIDGIYFSNAEKQEAQYTKKIMILNRRIYAIKTKNKYAYVYLRKKYIDEIIH